MSGTIARLRVLLAVSAFLLALGAAATARASTFPVTKTADTADGSCAPSDCSLREAVIAANANAGPDRITLPAGIYNLTRTGIFENASSTGDLDLSGDTTLTGAGARSAIIDGQKADRVIDIPGGNAIISGVTIRNGTSGPDEPGGGIRVGSQASLTLSDSAVVDNTGAGSDGPGRGGGISSDGGSVNVSRSLIARNKADQGGGVYLFFAPATFTNVTITQNGQGNNAVPGAGVYVLGGAATRFLNVTLAGNGGTSGTSSVPRGAPEGSGIFVRGGEGGDDVRATNTIVAGNSPVNCAGTISSGGHNLDSGASCNFGASGDQINTNPKLGSLANNGGPTDTLALLSGSPAIDRADNGPCPATDQRGVTRPQPAEGVCDIGAYEVPASTDLSITESDSPDPVVLGGTLTYTLTGTNKGAGGDSSVTIKDHLPSSVQFLSAKPSQGTCTVSGQTVTCQVGSLPGSSPAGARPRAASASHSVKVRIRVRPRRTGILANPVTISGAESETSTANNRARVRTRVIERNRPRISISALPSACVTGDFTVRVRITDESNVRSDVLLDGHAVGSTTRKSFTVRVHAGRLGSRRHTITVAAVDHYHNHARRSASFRRCRRARLPQFTG